MTALEFNLGEPQFRRIARLSSLYPDRIVVIGNMKFDGLDTLVRESRDLQHRFADVKARLEGRRCIVAGSVQAHWEIERAIEAFHQARARIPGLFMVIAPRYPKMPGRMDFLLGLLHERTLRHVLRSEDATDSWAEVDVLVLDTVGELRYFYGLADLTYLGVNHNVLEPLAFGNPVFVSSGWVSTYPSFPVYKQLLERGVLKQIDDTAALVAGCIDTLGQDSLCERDKSFVADSLRQQQGGTARALAAWHEQLGWQLP